MKKFEKHAVGETYCGSVLAQDGAIFDWTSHGLHLRIYLADPSDTEITAIRRSAAFMGFVCDNALLGICWKFGANMTGDAFFHVSRYLHAGQGDLIPHPPQLLTDASRISVLVTLIDTASRRVKALRDVSLSPAQSRFLVQQLEQQLISPIDNPKYETYHNWYLIRYPELALSKSRQHYEQLGKP